MEKSPPALNPRPSPLGCSSLVALARLLVPDSGSWRRCCLGGEVVGWEREGRGGGSGWTREAAGKEEIGEGETSGDWPKSAGSKSTGRAGEPDPPSPPLAASWSPTGQLGCAQMRSPVLAAQNEREERDCLTMGERGLGLGFHRGALSTNRAG